MDPTAIAYRHVNIDCRYPEAPNGLSLPALPLDCVGADGLLSVALAAPVGVSEV